MASGVLGTGLKAGANAKVDTIIVGEAIAEGSGVYRSSSDKKHYACIASGTLEQATCEGVTIVATTADGQTAVIVREGDIEGASGLTEGEARFVSGTVAGQFETDADLVTSTEYKHYVYMPTSATVVSVKPHNSGAQVP